jgi:hypothetical protein
VSPTLSGFNVNTYVKGSYLKRFRLPVGIGGVAVTTGVSVVIVVRLLPILTLLNNASNSSVVVPGTVRPSVDANVSNEIYGTRFEDVTFESY